MPEELLIRAVTFFRIGMNAYGCISFTAFVQQRKSDNFLAEALQAQAALDWIRLADILEYKIGPEYGVKIRTERAAPQEPVGAEKACA